MFKNINFAHHQSLPIDYLQEFSPEYRLPIGTILIIMYLGGFGYAVYYFYTENTTEEFVAIEEGNNRCTEVIRPLDGTFLASSNGRWEGDSAFRYSKAPVIAIFRELMATKKIFQEIFSETQKNLKEVNSFFMTNNLAMNILFWTSIKKSIIIEDKVHTFQLVGDPSFVFNSPITAGVLSSGTAVCNIQPTSIFNSESGKFEISYALSEYVSVGSGCRQVLDEVTAAFAVPFLTTTVRIVIDSRSFMTAMALNMGIVSSDTNFDFDVSDPTEIALGNGDSAYIANVKDTRYPGMTPVFCVLGNVCAMQVGKYLAMPIFDHWGDSLMGSPRPCSCSAGNGNSEWCNTFDFILGLLVIGTVPDAITNTSSASASAAIEVSLAIVETYNGSYAAFNAHWAPVVRAQMTLGSDPQTLKDAFVDKAFSLISIRSVNSDLKIISKYAYELNNGSCNGALNDILTNWENLSASPPKPLVEPYLKCNKDILFSTVDAVGVGMSDCDLVMRVIAYLLLPLILIFVRRFTGVRMLHPARESIDSLTEILYRTQQSLRGQPSKKGGHPKGSSFSVLDDSSTKKGVVSVSVSAKDKAAAAAEIIRLLSIALNEEEEAAEEGRGVGYGGKEDVEIGRDVLVGVRKKEVQDPLSSPAHHPKHETTLYNAKVFPYGGIIDDQRNSYEQHRDAIRDIEEDS